MMTATPMTELRLRSKVSDEALAARVGKVLADDDYDVLLRRRVRILKPDGKPLAVYLPGALDPEILEQSYDTLHALRAFETDNRGLASGTMRVADGTRTRSKLVPSAIIGAFDPSSRFTYCRLTAWTGKEAEKFHDLLPLFQSVARAFEQHVPDRYAVQMSYVRQTVGDWIITDTPFSTATINNSYATGVHQDAGDLEAGFSTLSCLRYGRYSGGQLVFPEYRVAVDMQHGDVLLMDAHEWHGNVALVDETPECAWCDEKATETFTAPHLDTGKLISRDCCATHFEQIQKQDTVKVKTHAPIEPMERISVVLYYRSRMVACGTAEEEAAKAAASAEQRSKLTVVDEMALEAAGVRSEGA